MDLQDAAGDPKVARIADSLEERQELSVSPIWTFSVSPGFEEWADLLASFEIQEHAAVRFSMLAARGAPGRAEASKILQQLLYTNGSFDRDSTAWLMGAVQNSISYIENWESYEGHAPRPRNLQELRRSDPPPPPAPGATPAQVPFIPGVENPWAAWEANRANLNTPPTSG